MVDNGLVPYRLVLGRATKFPTINTDLPTQKNWMEELKTSQAEMNTIVAEKRNLTALTHDITSAFDQFYIIGKNILICYEKRRNALAHLFIFTWMAGWKPFKHRIGLDRKFLMSSRLNLFLENVFYISKEKWYHVAITRKLLYRTILDPAGLRHLKILGVCRTCESQNLGSDL